MQHKTDCMPVTEKSPALTLASKDACTDRWYSSLMTTKQQTINPIKAKTAILLPQNSIFLCLTRLKTMNVQTTKTKTVEIVTT